MGQPKVLLPWGRLTVLAHIIAVLKTAIAPGNIRVITGADRELVEAAAQENGVKSAFNPDFAAGEMLSSLQIGLTSLGTESAAALVCLGDQPQVRESTIRALAEMYDDLKAALIVPSYERRRGHPWLLGRPLWDEVQAMRPPQTLRDLLDRHAGEIAYLPVATPSVVGDLDTPEDYLKYRPSS